MYSIFKIIKFLFFRIQKIQIFQFYYNILLFLNMLSCCHNYLISLLRRRKDRHMNDENKLPRLPVTKADTVSATTGSSHILVTHAPCSTCFCRKWTAHIHFACFCTRTGNVKRKESILLPAAPSAATQSWHRALSFPRSCPHRFSFAWSPRSIFCFTAYANISRYLRAITPINPPHKVTNRAPISRRAVHSREAFLSSWDSL